jgi:hypothetical protein
VDFRRCQNGRSDIFWNQRERAHDAQRGGSVADGAVMPDEPRVVDAEPNAFAFHIWRNISIIVWHTQATGPAVERLAAVTREMMRDHPGGFSSVHIAKIGAPMPSPEGRQAFLDLLKVCTPQLKCAAVLIGGDGFWASALRGAATGLWLAFPKTFELNLSSDVDEVARWLAPKHEQKTGVRLDPEAVASVLRDLTTRNFGRADGAA